jgi:hypothetical protein
MQPATFRYDQRHSGQRWFTENADFHVVSSSNRMIKIIFNKDALIQKGASATTLSGLNGFAAMFYLEDS